MSPKDHFNKVHIRIDSYHTFNTCCRHASRVVSTEKPTEAGWSRLTFVYFHSYTQTRRKITTAVSSMSFFDLYYKAPTPTQYNVQWAFDWSLLAYHVFISKKAATALLFQSQTILGYMANSILLQTFMPAHLTVVRLTATAKCFLHVQAVWHWYIQYTMSVKHMSTNVTRQSAIFTKCLCCYEFMFCESCTASVGLNLGCVVLLSKLSKNINYQCISLSESLCVWNHLRPLKIMWQCISFKISHRWPSG